MVASYNDYRRGDGNCYASYSVDGGRNWATRRRRWRSPAVHAYGAARQYWQAGGDTSVAWDTQGQRLPLVPDVPARPRRDAEPRPVERVLRLPLDRQRRRVVELPGPAGRAEPRHVHGEDDALPGQAADDRRQPRRQPVPGPASTSRWTTFAADGTAYIYEAHSNDYGEHFSAPVLVSTRQRAVRRTPSACRPRRAAATRTSSRSRSPAPTATLYVVWANFNNVVTGADNRNQMLLARSTDGGADVQRPGQGRRLLRPARLRHLPGRRRRPGPRLRAGEGRRVALGLPRDELPVRRRRPDEPVAGRRHLRLVHQPNSKESNGCAPAGFAPDDGINLFTGVKTAGACNNEILFSVSTERRRDLHRRRGRRRPAHPGDGQRAAQAGTRPVVAVGRVQQARASSPSPTTTASTATTRPPATPTSASPARTTCRPSGRSGSRARRCRRRPSSRASSSATTRGSTRSTTPTRSGPTRATRDLFLCPGTGTPGNPPDVCLGTESGRPAGRPDRQRRGHLHRVVGHPDALTLGT